MAMNDPMSETPFTSVKVLRAEARKRIEQGPVTPSYPEDRDPTTSTMLEGILAQVEEHPDDFRDLLA